MSNTKNLIVYLSNLEKNHPPYFSKLSSFTTSKFEIGNMYYDSPIHYMCIKILKGGNYFLLKNTPSPFKVLKLFEKNYEIYEQNTLLNKLEEGIYSRFSTNHDLKKLLLDTGEKTLYYLDNEDKYLGWSRRKDDNSINLLGRAYMNVRNRIREEQIKEENQTEEIRKDQLIVQLLKIIKILHNKMFSEFNNLSDYKGYNYDHLVTVLKEDINKCFYPDETLLYQYYNQVILQKIDSGIYNMLQNMLHNEDFKDNLVTELRRHYRTQFNSVVEGQTKMIKRKIYMGKIFQKMEEDKGSNKTLSQEEISEQYFALISSEFKDADPEKQEMLKKQFDDFEKTIKDDNKLEEEIMKIAKENKIIIPQKIEIDSSETAFQDGQNINQSYDVSGIGAADHSISTNTNINLSPEEQKFNEAVAPGEREHSEVYQDAIIFVKHPVENDDYAKLSPYYIFDKTPISIEHYHYPCLILYYYVVFIHFIENFYEPRPFRVIYEKILKIKKGESSSNPIAYENLSSYISDEDNYREYKKLFQEIGPLNEKIKMKLLEKGIFEKFAQDERLQKILTQNSTNSMVFKDTEQRNFVGFVNTITAIMLTELRKKYIKAHEIEQEIKQEAITLSEMFGNDYELLVWVYMRIKDILMVTVFFKKNMVEIDKKLSDGKSILIENHFVVNLLYYLYNTCNIQFDNNEIIVERSFIEKVEQIFSSVINDVFGEDELGKKFKLAPDAIVEIWKYATKLAYLLFYEHVKNERINKKEKNKAAQQNISGFLEQTKANLAVLKHNAVECQIKIGHIDQHSDIDKCVCSAILNIMKNIILINRKQFCIHNCRLILEVIFGYHDKVINELKEKYRLYKDNSKIFEQIFIEYPSIAKLIYSPEKKDIIIYLNIIYDILLRGISTKSNSDDILQNRINFFASLKEVKKNKLEELIDEDHFNIDNNLETESPEEVEKEVTFDDLPVNIKKLYLQHPYLLQKSKVTTKDLKPASLFPRNNHDLQLQHDLPQQRVQPRQVIGDHRLQQIMNMGNSPVGSNESDDDLWDEPTNVPFDFGHDEEHDNFQGFGYHGE